MSKYLTMIGSLLLLFVTPSIALTNSNADWRPYIDARYNFTVDYPSNLVVRHATSNSTAFLEGDVLKWTISYYKKNEVNINELTSMDNHFSNSASKAEDMVINNISAKKITVTTQEDPSLLQQSIFLEDRESVFIISSEGKYDENFKNFYNSFRFINPDDIQWEIFISEKAGYSVEYPSYMKPSGEDEYGSFQVGGPEHMFGDWGGVQVWEKSNKPIERFVESAKKEGAEVTLSDIKINNAHGTLITKTKVYPKVTSVKTKIFIDMGEYLYEILGSKDDPRYEHFYKSFRWLDEETEPKAETTLNQPSSTNVTIYLTILATVTLLALIVRRFVRA